MINNIFKQFLKEDYYDKILNNAEYLIQRSLSNYSENYVNIIKEKYSSNLTYEKLSEKYNMSKTRIGQIIRKFNSRLRWEVDVYLRDGINIKTSLSDFKIINMISELDTILYTSLLRYFRFKYKNLDPTLQDVKNMNEGEILSIRNLGKHSYHKLLQVIEEKENEIKKI